jgi:hypothetical protein
MLAVDLVQPLLEFHDLLGMAGDVDGLTIE